MAPPTDQSQRVTLAVLGTKMDSIAEDLKDFIAEQKTCNKDTIDRLGKVEGAQISFASFRSVVIWVGTTVGGAIILFLILVGTGQLQVIRP